MVLIRHTGLVTRNLKESIFFWCDLIGFKVYRDNIEYGQTLDKVLKIKNVKVRTLKLSDKKKNLLELLHFIYPTKKKKKFFFINREE